MLEMWSLLFNQVGVELQAGDVSVNVAFKVFEDVYVSFSVTQP